jgi:hypothetical protein
MVRYPAGVSNHAIAKGRPFGLHSVGTSRPAETVPMHRPRVRRGEARFCWSSNPVVSRAGVQTLAFVHKRLYSMKGPEPTEETVPLGEAAVVREGGDVTIVSAPGACAMPSSPARSWPATACRPMWSISARCGLDHKMVLESVARTNRLVLVEEGPGSAAGRGIRSASSRRRDCTSPTTPGSSTDHTPAPYSPTLKHAWLPAAADIAAAVPERLSVAATGLKQALSLGVPASRASKSAVPCEG